MSLADPVRPQTAASRRWLSIVGIGEDGVDGLSPVARGLVGGAEIVFGGKRHLALAAALIRGAARPWPSPFDGAVDEVLAQRGRHVCVLASGDPFVHGVGAVLARHVDPSEMLVVPAPSAFSLAAARLGWALPETALVSLHARALDLVRPHLQPGARVLALTSDGDGPAALARLLADTGFGASRVHRAGGARRCRASASARRPRGDASIFATSTPSTSSRIEVAAAAGARIIARAAGLPMPCSSMTARSPSAKSAPSRCRRSRRAAANCCGTSAPAPARSRSNGCWPTRRCAPSRSRRGPDRAARIRRNAAAFGVPGLDVIEGAAPAALATACRQPDAIFIGGGAADRGVLDARIGGAAPRRAARRQCGDARDRGAADRAPCRARRRIDPARDQRAPSRSAARPACVRRLPVTQWRWIKPTVVGEAMIVAGVGCRKGAHAAEIEAAIAAALARAGARATQLRAHRDVGSQRRRARHCGGRLGASASRWFSLPQHDLAAAGARAVTRRSASSRSPACRRSPKRRRSRPAGRRRG